MFFKLNGVIKPIPEFFIILFLLARFDEFCFQTKDGNFGYKTDNGTKNRLC